MTPDELAEYLCVLRDGGAMRASIPVRPGEMLQISLAETPLPANPNGYVDKHGQPINLDEDAPPLANEHAVDDLYAKNFRPKG